MSTTRILGLCILVSAASGVASAIDPCQAIRSTSKRGDTRACFRAGLAFEKGGHNQEALEAFQRVRQLDPANPDVLVALVRTSLRLGRMTDALDALTELVPSRSARLADLFGRELADVQGPADPAKAVRFYEGRRKRAQARRDRVAEIAALRASARVMDAMGKPKEAEQSFLTAREVAHETGDRALEAQVVLDKALFSQNRDRYDVALQLYDSALADFLRADDHQRAAEALIGLGEVHQLVGDLDEAERWFHDALGQASEAGDRNLQLRALGMLASVANDRDDTAQTRQCTQTALSSLRSLLQDWLETTAGADGFPLTPDGAVALQMLGEVEAWNGNVDSAIACSKLALALHRVAARASREALGEVAGDLYNLGLAYQQVGQLRAAWSALEEARRVDQRVHDPDDYILLNEMGSVKEEEGQLDEALTLYSQAIDILDRIGHAQRAGRVQLSVRDEAMQFYLDAVATSLKLQANGRNDGNAIQAFQYLERGKAHTLLDMINETREPGSEQVRSLKRALSEQVPAGRQAHSDLEAAVASEAAAVSTASSHAASDRSQTARSETASIIDVQALLDDHTILLEYALGERPSGEEVSALWVVTRTDVRLLPLARGDRIADLVARYRKTLDTPLIGPDEIKSHIRLGQRLYHILVQPAADEIRGREHVVVIPAGALCYLPFEALIRPTAHADGRMNPALSSVPYLARQYAVSYAPSASVLVFLTRRGYSEGVSKEQPQLPLLAFGDPVYSSAPEGRAVAFNVRGTYERMSHGFGRLPYSANEVQRIASLYGVAPGSDVINLRERATKRRLQDIDLRRYRILHFATHAVVGDDVKWINQPTLVFSDTDGENPFLKMSEIFDLRLNAELVVLSACNTAEGKLYRGEGLVGLTSAFLYAGSRAVVASLWPVNDQSTSLFMEAFYRHLRDGATKADALRLARIELMERTVQSDALGREESLAAPYFWAPFVLIGAWS
ncbi:MAG TPA: CHAT domain-containing protein [Candidatus Binatia bacterium]|nr:CHAT domain-containing protein [Candidatus Binatia bacterium]